MKRIKQIFDGEYGCEERTADERLKYWSSWRMKPARRAALSVEDDWLRAQGLEEGSAWPEN